MVSLKSGGERGCVRQSPKLKGILFAMSALNPTPPDQLVDERGRPYFLWDLDMDLETFRERLRDPDPKVRGYMAGKLMRQAKPDDVFSFLTTSEIEELWPHLVAYLGTRRAMWEWILMEWGLTLHAG